MAWVEPHTVPGGTGFPSGRVVILAAGGIDTDPELGELPDEFGATVQTKPDPPHVEDTAI